MKTPILIIALLFPVLCFAQRQGLVIPFADNISINLPEGVEVYETNHDSDTLFVAMGIGRAVGEHAILFKAESEVSNIELSQRTEYCFVISDEGPHVDLRDWLLDYTPWISVPRSGQQYRLVDKEPEVAKPTQPEFDLNSSEFIAAIEAEGFKAGRWLEAAKRPGAINWLASRIILKVAWEDNGQASQKIIVFELPLGC